MENLEMEKEIGDLIDMPIQEEPLIVEETPVAVEPPPAEEVPPTVGETPPVEDALPPAEPPEVLPAADQPPPASTPSVDPRDAEMQSLRDTIASLQQTIEAVSKQAVAPVQQVQEQLPSASIKFIETEEAFDKALNNVDNFNALLQSVIEKAHEAWEARLPQVVSPLIHQTYNQRSIVDDFYRANQDLATNKAYVGIVANEIAAQHPDWDMGKVIENLAGEVRNRLRLGNVPASTTPSPIEPPLQTPPPAFAGNPGARRGTPTPMSKVEQEIADLLDGV